MTLEMKENKMDRLLRQLMDSDPVKRKEAVDIFWSTTEACGLEKMAELQRHLFSALEDGDALVRAAAARSLCEFYDPEAVKALLEALTDRDEMVVLNAAESLRQYGLNFDYLEYGRKGLKLLNKALGDKNRNVRWGAVRAIGAFRRPEKFRPLLKALKDEDASVRKEAVWGLAEPSILGDGGFVLELPGEVLLPLIKALSDSDAEVREWAANALLALPDVRAVAPLIRLLSDESCFVRESAERALGKIRESGCVAENSVVLPVRKLAWELRNGEKRSRRWAAWGLGRAEPHLSRGPLVKALVDDDIEVRRIAARALRMEDIPINLYGFAASLRREEAPLSCALGGSWVEWSPSTFRERYQAMRLDLEKKHGPICDFSRKKMIKKIRPEWFTAPDDPSRLPLPQGFDLANDHLPGHKHCEFRLNDALIHIDCIRNGDSSFKWNVQECVIFVDGVLAGHGRCGDRSSGTGISMKPLVRLDKNRFLTIEASYLSDENIIVYRGE